MQSLHLLLLLLLAWGAQASPVEQQIPLEHSIGLDGPWTARGAVILAQSDKKLSVKLAPSVTEFSAENSRALIEAANKGEPYRVRMRATEKAGVLGQEYVLASTGACALLRDAKELFMIHLDKAGSVSALQYDRPVKVACVAPVQGLGKDFVFKLESKILASVPKEAAPLPGTHWTAYDEKSRPADEASEPKQDAGSFVQKYWYICECPPPCRAPLTRRANPVLPVTLYTLFCAPAAPAEAAAAAAPAAKKPKRTE
jgi:hypothetical protein